LPSTAQELDDEKKKEKEHEKKQPTYIDDDYAECYPGYEEQLNTMLYDSDDEDLTKMDQADRGKPKLKPWDFQSEEQWEKYNITKEATPKAAFQFGQKMNDGRVKGVKKSKRKETDEQKLNKEWSKIKQIMKKREPKLGPVVPAQSEDDRNRENKRQKILKGFNKK